MRTKLHAGELSATEQAIARIVSRQPMIKNAALGLAAGVNETEACRIKKRQHVQAAIARLGASSGDGMRDRVRIGGDIGLDVLIHLAQNSKSELVRLKAAARLVDAASRMPAVVEAPPSSYDQEVAMRRLRLMVFGSGPPLPVVEANAEAPEPEPVV